MGKGPAIIAGVKQAHRNGSEICMILDIDVFNLSVRKIERLPRDLVKSKHNMVIPMVAEGYPQKRDGVPNGTVDTIGERAFYTKCFDPVLKGTKLAQRFRSLMYRMGADQAMQQLIRNHGLSEVIFNTANPFRNVGQRRQNEELLVVLKRKFHRKEVAMHIRHARRKGSKSPEAQKQKRDKLRKDLLELKKKHRHLR